MRGGYAVLLCLVLCCWPRSLAAQADTTIYSADTPRWVGQFATASANVLVSALTAGVIQEIKGASFRDGFTRGALGGLVIYAGKRITVENFAGAGLLGREVAAVGTSMVRNASDGIGTFDRLVLPVGVARVYWQRTPRSNYQVKIDAVALGWTVYGIIEPELDFNFSQSLSDGTPVFQTRDRILDVGDGNHAGGVTQAGVIFLTHVPRWGQDFLERVRAHERVHTIQMDQIFLTLNDPHDDQLLRRLPASRITMRWLDLNVSTELMRFVNTLIDKHADRPWETEAIYLSR